MERIAEQLAAGVHAKDWCSYDYDELREVIQQQHVDTLLRMGESELRNQVDRLMFERQRQSTTVLNVHSCQACCNKAVCPRRLGCRARAAAIPRIRVSEEAPCQTHSGQGASSILWGWNYMHVHLLIYMQMHLSG